MSLLTNDQFSKLNSFIGTFHGKQMTLHLLKYKFSKTALAKKDNGKLSGRKA